MLLDGSVKLFSYSTSNYKRFFYSENNIVKQLEHKLYYNSKKQVRENLNYIKQLKDFLPCNKLNAQKVKYNQKSMVKYFYNYNLKCTNFKKPIINYTKKDLKGKINLFVKIGIGVNRLKVTTVPTLDLLDKKSILVDYGNNTTYNLGAELEYIAPFNNYKWSLFFEPSFQSNSATYSNPPNQNFKAEELTSLYSAIKIAIGIKHYLFLNDNNKLFLKLSPSIDIPINAEITANNRFTPSQFFNKISPITFKSKENISFLIGIGYDYNNKYRVELNYSTNRDIINSDSSNWDSDFESILIKISYKKSYAATCKYSKKIRYRSKVSIYKITYRIL